MIPDTISRDHPQFVPFLRFLFAEGYHAEDLFYVIEKPWKWQEEVQGVFENS